jgi:hypothetical protein
VSGDRRDRGGVAPARAAVGGSEREDRRFVRVVERHHDGPAGLHHGLATEAVGGVCRFAGGAPSQPPVGRGAHLDPVAVPVVIPFDVAVAVEGAGRGVVADDPVLVEVGARVARSGRGDGHRVTPGRAAVGRSIDDDGGSPARVRQRQRGDQPGVVGGVVGDARVAHAREAATRDSRDAGKEALGPGGAAVGRSRPPDVRRAAVEEAAHLECGDDGRPRRERVGFDLGRVLAGGVRVGVGAQACQGRRAGRERVRAAGAARAHADEVAPGGLLSAHLVLVVRPLRQSARVLVPVGIADGRDVVGDRPVRPGGRADLAPAHEGRTALVAGTGRGEARRVGAVTLLGDVRRSGRIAGAGGED